MAQALSKCGDRNGGKTRPFLKLWLLRLLVPLGGYRQWIGPLGFSDSEVARAVGLGHCLEAMDADFCHWSELKAEDFDADSDFSPRAAINDLRRLYARAENSGSRVSLPKALVDNCTRLAALVGLNDVENHVLAFAVLLHSEPLLATASRFLGELNELDVYRVLSVLLDIPVTAVRQALRPRGLLEQTGLVSIDESGMFYLPMKLDVLAQGFAGRMRAREDDPVNLFSDTFAPAAVPSLTLADFDHVRDMLDILVPHLRSVLNQAERGVNILIYGRPGTGKTQLVCCPIDNFAKTFELGKD